ncbi:hypothetical protein WKW50_16415 [Ochrobactrum sp. GPK 3]
MSEDEVRDLVKSTAEQTARETVRQTLLTLGVNSDDPIEMQADFRHLREWRKSVATVKRQGMITATIVVASGLLGLIWQTLSTKSGG